MDRTEHYGRADLSRLYDAIVIGTGAGGAALALRLGQLGLQVLVVEQGDFLMRHDSGGAGQASGYIDHMLNGDSQVSFVGGRTKFYGAALYRLREIDFLETEHERGLSPAWPITYSDLEPYYEQAERLYRVHGSPEGDPSEPPRAGPYPHPPIAHAPVVARMVRRLERTGTWAAAIPIGIDLRPGGKCVLCATCDAHHCTLDAKMDAETAALRPALATCNVRLTVRTTCLRVLTDEAGRRATGVLLRRDGAEHFVRAVVVAVCAGVPGSAALLWRSRTEGHPKGLGNAGGSLGRYLAGHSAGLVFPFVGWRAVPPTYTKTFAINQYYERGPEWPYPLGVVQATGQMPFWEKVPVPFRPMAKLIGTRSLMFFYMAEALPTRETGFDFNGTRPVLRSTALHNLATFARLRFLAAGAFRRAGYPTLAPRRKPSLWHEVGTVRFGTDPATSVVDPNCQVHGINGLYVADASVLPSAGAVNTALTIGALALRAGDHIGGRVQAARTLEHAGAK
jgi:choline dehydrogenase-like flavoprotein